MTIYHDHFGLNPVIQGLFHTQKKSGKAIHHINLSQ